jgi:NAD+ synthase (glutamine-hydrolysing)
MALLSSLLPSASGSAPNSHLAAHLAAHPAAHPAAHRAFRHELGFVRVGVCSPALHVADVGANVRDICEAIDRATAASVDLLVLPELCLTGYSCGDLFYQRILLDRAVTGLWEICDHIETLIETLAAGTQNTPESTPAPPAVIVGLPLQLGGRTFNCAAFIVDGRVMGIVPKTFLPGTGEFYEERWFSSAADATATSITLSRAAFAKLSDSSDSSGSSSSSRALPATSVTVPFGSDILFRSRSVPDYCVGVEICEDGWAAVPPSVDAALSGATILVNISASNEVIGKADYRRDLVKAHSARCLAAYCYAAASAGESTTDLVFSGHSIIAENSRILAETERFRFATELAIADVDVQRMTAERLRNNTFGLSKPQRTMREVLFDAPFDGLFNGLFNAPSNALSNAPSNAAPELHRVVNPLPFVPQNPLQRSDACHEIFLIQTTGLAKRLLHTGCKRVVVGVSGGLDSTLALLVCAKAFDTLGLPRTGITSVTMPGFGTTSRTRGNAEVLAELLGTTLRVIPIADAVRQHFRDIGHSEDLHDITYENAQARERTQILMDIANQENGIVLGTGDLSELALGWCTYNADQMSMYNVNASIPKTLVRTLVAWCADTEFASEFTSAPASTAHAQEGVPETAPERVSEGIPTQSALQAALRDICATPVSPELLPLQHNAEGAPIQAQETEKTIGPYELHDFFLYCTVRFQFSPRKVLFLAEIAYTGKYTRSEILRWLEVFYKRFFTQQFKRSAMPDGPKVGTVALSPRGDWRMPSDASYAVWMEDLERLRG